MRVCWGAGRMHGGGGRRTAGFVLRVRQAQELGITRTSFSRTSKFEAEPALEAGDGAYWTVRPGKWLQGGWLRQHSSAER